MPAFRLVVRQATATTSRMLQSAIPTSLPRLFAQVVLWREQAEDEGATILKVLSTGLCSRVSAPLGSHACSLPSDSDLIAFLW